MPEFLLFFSILALILLISALLSQVVERSPLSFPILFLGLGILLGPRVLGLVDIGPHDPFLEVVATLTLALVLFLDAVNLQVDALKHIISERVGEPVLLEAQLNIRR